MRWRSWLRHCATSRKIAGSIPGDIIGIFHWHISDSYSAYQKHFLGVKGGRCVGLTTLPPSCAKCLDIWEPQHPGTLKGLSRPVMGFVYIYHVLVISYFIGWFRLKNHIQPLISSHWQNLKFLNFTLQGLHFGCPNQYIQIQIVSIILQFHNSLIMLFGAWCIFPIFFVYRFLIDAFCFTLLCHLCKWPYGCCTCILEIKNWTEL